MKISESDLCAINFLSIWTCFSFVPTSIASMQSIFSPCSMVIAVIIVVCVFQMNGKTYSQIAGIVIILLLFYLNWSESNDMHIHKSHCKAKNVHTGKNITIWHCNWLNERARRDKKNGWPGSERVSIACQIEWKMYEKIIEIVIIIITRREVVPIFFPSISSIEWIERSTRKTVDLKSDDIGNDRHRYNCKNIK